MLQPLLSRPIARGTAGAALAATLAVTSLHAGGTPSSPVRPVASINRSQFNATEWNALVNHFDMVIGLTASGYDFPGPIATFRAANPTTPVLTYVELTAIQGGNIGDDRYDQYDEIEDVFFHTADPASLRVYTVSGGVALTWMRDSRDRSGGTYTAPGVTEYLIESAPSASGPWTQATAFAETGATFNTTTLPGASTSAWYRIRSHLDDGRIVDYARPVQPDPASTVIASGIFAGTTFTAVVHGPDAPTNAANLRLEVDVNGNRVWESFEYVGATSRVSLGNGYWEYTGTTPIPTSRANYRFRLTNVAGSTTPANASYTQVRRNNRLQTKFGAFIIKPAHPLTHTIHIQRLRDALDVGYDGVHLDFAYDDMSPSWITVADVVAHEQAQAANLANSVRDLIGALHDDRPNALIHFNGYFVTEDPANYYAYLGEATGGAFEFFAFGFQEGATDVHPTSAESVDNIIETSHIRNKVSVAVAFEAADNIAARLKSLALYLVVAHPKVHFAYTSTDHQSIDWYPEYRVPLGTPVIPTLDGTNHVHPSSPDVLYRRYTHGEVYFNFGDTPFEVDLPSTKHRLNVTGGLDPILGGDGEAFYVPVSQLTVAPGEGAVLITDSPEGSSFNTGDADGDQCGRALAPIGDVNGDGVADYAIGLPYNDDAGADAGRVDICSGATGAVLRSAAGDQAGERFGESIAGPGDVNDDGVPDLLVGAPYNDDTAGNAGAAYVIDGATGAQIDVRYGQAAGDRFGHAVGGGMDVNGDGVGDLIVGAPYNDNRGNNAGRVEVISGATRQRLKLLRGDHAGDRFGWSVASIGRTKGPGRNDFAVGAPFNDDGGSNAGKVYVYEGDGFGVNFTFEGRKAGDQLGRAVAGVGRADDDARDDILVGAPYTKVQGDAKRGRIELFSGHDGDRVWSKTGASAGERFGWSVAAAGDVDGDGKIDVIAGAPFHDDDGRGRVDVRRGVNGAALATYFGEAVGHRFGWATAGIDPDGADGPDILVADPTDDLVGTNAGRVHHVILDAPATAAAEASPCPADMNGDRAVDLSDLLQWLETDGFAAERAPDLTSIIATWGPC